MPDTLPCPTKVPSGTLREDCLKTYRHMLRARLIEEKLAGAAKQADAAQQFCNENAARGSYPFGCPVRYSTTGPIVP